MSSINGGVPPQDLWRVDEAVEAGSRIVEGDLHRVFYPELTTRYFDWPSRTSGSSYRVWLDPHEAISITTLTSGGDEIALGDYNLEPDEGPPYDRIEIDRASSAAFVGGSTSQRNIAAVGLFGYSDNSESVGVSASTIDSDDTTLDIGANGRVGVGSVLKAGTERMVVTDRDWLTSSQTLQTPVTANPGDRSIAVSSGTGFVKGEYILLDTEQMLIESVVGNSLIVRRAQFGSVLAAHTGSTVYAPRRLTIRRGVLGTTAADHASGASLTRWVPSSLLTSLTAAESLSIFLAENAGYARTIGSGESEREVRGNTLQDLRKRALKSLGRLGRTGAV